MALFRIPERFVDEYNVGMGPEHPYTDCESHRQHGGQRERAQ